MNKHTLALRNHRISTQVKALKRADNAARAVLRPIRSGFNQLAGLIATKAKPPRVRRLCERIQQDVMDTMRDELEEAAYFGWTSGVDGLLDSIPDQWWIAYAKYRAATFMEGKNFAKTFARQAAADAVQSAKDVIAGLMSIADDDEEPQPKRRALKSARRKKIEEHLFKPPSRAEAEEVLRSDRWPDRKTWPQRLAEEGFSYDAIVTTIATGHSQGKTLKEITADVLPLVNDIGYRARRIARTESLRIAQTMQRIAEERIGDMIYARQIKSVGDERVRPEHAARDGTIYYKIGYGPPGSERYEDCPWTPDAPNCRCTTFPLLIGTDTIGLEKFPQASTALPPHVRRMEPADVQ